MQTITLPRMDEAPRGSSESGFGAMQSKHGNLPLAALAYKTRLSGLAISTTLTQTFYNPYDECIEATYIFPLDGEQAVVKCEMLVGDRVIRANLKERGEAREDYKRAIRKGHRAALLEENRSETFSLSVGNIPAGEAIQVRITTVGQLAVSRGQWTLRLPLVVAPRYVSGIALPGRSIGGGVADDTNSVPDASAVTPPTLLPGFPNPVHLKIDVEIEPSGLVSIDDWASLLESSLHSVLVHRIDDSDAVHVTTHPGERVNRDFILRGRFDDSDLVASLEIESNEGADSTFAIHLIPPKSEVHVPRDVSFVLDRSGSMSGWKMKAAARGICRLIDTLNEGDRFSVIAFDDRIETPFAKKGVFSRRAKTNDWVEATDRNRWSATQWLSKISSRGGTEMAEALRLGLRPFERTSRELDSKPRSSALVLVTDGQIAGEDTVLQALSRCPDASRPRIYCLGIDRAVNASVLRRLSNASGGTFELVDTENRLDEVLETFSGEIGSPSLTGLAVTANGWQCDTFCFAPQNRTDLYHGRSISIFGRFPKRDEVTLTVSGRLPNGTQWSRELSTKCNVSDDHQSPLLLPLWGRNRVRELEDRFVAEGCCDDGLRQTIINCSLETQVLSRFTAYVAIDEAERVNDGRQPHRITQPVEQPEGWNHQFPRLEQTMLISTRVKRKRNSRDLARKCGVPFIRVLDYQIPVDIVELVPESVARENTVMPLSRQGHEITIVVSDPTDGETIENMRFILNRPINIVVDSSENIQAAINHHYGQIEGESADSLLQEFTDTAIDFTRSTLAAAADPVLRSDDDDMLITRGLSMSSDLMMDDMYDDELAPPPASYGFADRRTRDARVRRKSTNSGRETRLTKTASIPERMLSKSKKELAEKPALVDESVVVKFLQQLLDQAVKLGASHILIRPDEDVVNVGFVIDGRYLHRDRIPFAQLKPLMVRLRILAGIDLTSTGLVVEGQMQQLANGKLVDATVKIAPVDDGESALIEFDAAADRCVELDDWNSAVNA